MWNGATEPFRPSASRPLLVVYFNLPGGVGLEHLGDGDAEDAILQTGLDAVVVDTGREGEAPGELAHATFGDPVRVLWLMFGDVLASGGGDLCAGRPGLWLLLLLLRFLGRGWLAAFFTVVLGAAPDGEGVFVGELDGHVLLVDTGEFTFQGVPVLGLLDVEFGGEGALGRVGHLLEFGKGVVEELEERSHLLTVRAAECRSEAWE